MKLHYTSRAMDDIDVAIAWYERQQKGLGIHFLDCIEASALAIQTQPKIYKTHHSLYRACIVRRFPFTIFYTIEGNEIIVHSVFHNRLDPDKRP